MEDRCSAGRSRPGRAGLRPPIPLSPEEEIRGRSGPRITDASGFIGRRGLPPKMARKGLASDLVRVPPDADELVGFELERAALRVEVDDDLRGVPDASDLQAGKPPRDHYEIARLQICSSPRDKDRVGHTVIVAGPPRRRALQPYAHPPFVLGEQHVAKCDEARWRVDERTQDRVTILDRKGDELLLGLQATMSASAVSWNPASHSSRARSSTSWSFAWTPAIIIGAATSFPYRCGVKRERSAK